MAFEDKTLTCSDCGKPFIFTAAEQEFYASKGFENEPKRCKECRMNKKNSFGRGGGARGDRATEWYTTVCSNCGGEAKVPFKPRGDKPVLCNNCFKGGRQ